MGKQSWDLCWEIRTYAQSAPKAQLRFSRNDQFRALLAIHVRVLLCCLFSLFQVLDLHFALRVCPAQEAVRAMSSDLRFLIRPLRRHPRRVVQAIRKLHLAEIPFLHLVTYRHRGHRAEGEEQPQQVQKHRRGEPRRGPRVPPGHVTEQAPGLGRRLSCFACLFRDLRERGGWELAVHIVWHALSLDAIGNDAV